MTQTAPLISVIVPVYKVEPYLRKCVDSILAQTYENLEIILVDDGSPDSCGAICDEYASREARIRVIHKENGGLSSARNAGLEVARGEYIGFVDSDDWLEPQTYQWLLEMAVKEQLPMVCAGRYDCDSRTEGRKVGLCPPKREVISGQELTKRIFLWDNVDSAAWDKLYDRSLFQKIRYPLGVVSEDLPVTYRLALAAGRVGMLDKPVYNYLHRPGSITTSSFSPRTLQPSDNTAKVLAHIREEFPDLLPYATYFHLRHLGYVCLTMEIAGRKVMREYKAAYRGKRKQLRQLLPFILTSPLIKKQERLTWVTICLGCYGALRRVYHLGRKK